MYIFYIILFWIKKKSHLNASNKYEKIEAIHKGRPGYSNAPFVNGNALCDNENTMRKITIILFSIKSLDIIFYMCTCNKCFFV